jgi:hypothetical protein
MTRKTDDEIRKQIEQLQAQYDDADFDGKNINGSMQNALKWVLGEIKDVLYYEENKK